MILILSNPIFQSSIDAVIDWLHYYKVPFVRVNGLNIDETEILKLFPGNEDDNEITIDGQKIIPSQIKAVWSYRWSHPMAYGKIELDTSLLAVEGNLLSKLGREKDTVSSYFFHLFRSSYWLSDVGDGTINKLIALKKAKQMGLDIPASAVVSKKTDLVAFMYKYRSVITKPVFELMHLPFEDYTYSSFTKELDDKINQLPDEFSPTLLQEKIEKQFEIRSFFLDGEFYSMAIFSQNDDQTKTDFRRYNRAKPNRNVPYQLPADVTEKLKTLLKYYDLNTASVDFLKSADGRLVFLEINPIGQFGMTSHPCNYFLERKIAQTLINKSKYAGT